MIKLMIFCYFLAGLITQTQASDDWICKDEASQRRGNTILSCGIGIGENENAARLSAFDNAKAEFDRICESTDACFPTHITIVPQRTMCEKTETNDYKCYRLISFKIQTLREAQILNHGLIAY